MKVLLYIAIVLALLYCLLKLTNYISYRVIKNYHGKKRQWDLNICCGKTNFGKVNADIICHKEVPNFVLIKDIYNLPFRDGQFEMVFCSHTIEHVDDPEKFRKELERVGNEVIYLLPPLWDLSAAFNFIEHKWVFFTLNSYHSSLPKYKKLPLSSTYQKLFGDKIKA